MKRNFPRRSTRRRWIAVFAILALLCNAAFAIACDFHDLGHPAMAHGGVRDVPAEHGHDHDHEPSHSHSHGHDTALAIGVAVTEADADAGGSIDWHAIFHVGHGVAQSLGLASLPALPAPALPARVTFPHLAARAATAPGASILRPPIRA